MAGRRRQSVKHILRSKYGPTKEEFHAAQKGICALCGRKIKNISTATYDHVHAHSKGYKVVGNVLLTHGSCNNKKKADDPHPIYVEILKIVNRKLGWNGSTYTECKNRKLRVKLMRICFAYQDHGIPVFMRDGKRLHVTPGRFDPDRLIEALAEHFTDLSLAEGIDPGDGVLRLVHKAFK